MRDGSKMAPLKTAATLLRRRDDPYAEADRENARRFGGLVLLLQAGLIPIFLAIASPAERIGGAGWAIGIATSLGSGATAAIVLRRGERVSDNVLLGLGYLAVAAIALLQWLASEYPSPYLALFLLWVVFVPASHPPRRVLVFLSFLAVAAVSPLLYDGWDATTAADLTGRLLVWLALAAIVVVRVEAFRTQRIGLGRSQAEAEERSLLDPLTGLKNRRAFDEVLAVEIARANRAELPMSLVLADLDGFKAVNDRWGHMVGDECLRSVATALESTLRAGDTAFRWGGDEFAVVLANAARADAVRACERIAVAIRGCWAAPDGLAVDAAFGVAQLESEMTQADLLAAADGSLIATKAPPR